MAEAAGDIFGPTDAETGDTTQFSSTVVDSGCALTASTDAEAHGTYGFKHLIATTQNDCRGVESFSDKTTIYVRAYFYMPSGGAVASTATNYMLTILDGTTHLVDFLLRRAAADAGDFDQYRVLGQDLTATTFTTNFSLDEWHYVEIYWYAGTGANGGATVWVDGDQVFSELNNDLTAYAADTSTLGVYACALGDGRFIYTDDWKGNSTAIGAYAEESGAANYIPAIYHYQRMRVA